MQTPKNKSDKTTYQKWRKWILTTFFVVIALPVALFTIGWFNRDTVIDVLQNWYSENNSGTLTIGKVNASFISGFPNVGFTLKDIKHTHTDTIADKFSSVQIDEAKMVIQSGNLLLGDIKFEKIRIKNAIITSEVISKRSVEYHKNLKRDKESNTQKGIKMPRWLHNDGVTFLLDNVKYVTEDAILNKSFNIDIYKIKGYYKRDKSQLKGNVSMDMMVNTLGFNTKKGSYFNGARVSGNPDFTIDLESNTISVPEFLFNVDAQNFNLSANFDLSETDTYDFKLKNPNTDFEELKGLLPNNITTKINLYNLQKPLNTDLHISGRFAYGSGTDVEADFSTENNDIVIAEKLHLKNVSFHGSLTNDIYLTDSLRSARKSATDLKIVFNAIKADLDNMKVAIGDAYYQSTPEALNFVKAAVNLKGKNEALAALIETENFDFEGGTFELDAAISGDIPNAYAFLNKAIGNFNLKNTRVVLKKNGLQLPVRTIDLVLERENSTLRQLVVNFPNGEDLVFKGKLKNVSALLAKNPKVPTKSAISLDSEKLNINEVIALAKRFMPKSGKNVDDRKNLHQTLDAIYSQFRPSFNINVEALTYNDVTITDVKSEIDLVNSETIQLRNFDFNYFDAITNLKGKVVVPEPESRLRDAIYINAEASSSGSVRIFEDLFDIKLFRIDAGTYQFNGTITGNLKEVSQILNTAKGDFTLNNTKLYYAPAAMDLNIDSLALFVDNADMLLKKFNLEIGELYPIQLTGNITKFPSFLIDKVKDKGAVSLKITAPFIDANSALSAINSLKNEDQLKPPKNKSALHQLFKDINKFNPEIEVGIDSLKYQNLITENVKALVYFKNDSILKLKNLDFNYNQTTANISGEVNAHTSRLDSLNNNPFDLDFLVSVKGKSKDLNAYLKTKNFIFQSGDFEFKGQYKAQAEDLKIMNTNGFGDLKISNTLVDYNAASLQIPVDSLHIKIEDDVATLTTLDIDLPGKSSVFFSGSISHFSDFINNTENNTDRSSNFSIYSPYLDASDIKAFLKNASSDKDDTTGDAFNLQKFKTSLVNINTSFYPTANITIDTLKNDDLELTDFGLNLLFNTTDSLKIKDTHLNFYGGALNIDVDFGLKNDDNIPVKIAMQADNIDLRELVTRLDYFNDDALRNTDKIEGTLNYTIHTTGSLDNEGQLNMNSLNGTIQLALSDFVLHNYKPIMDNSVLMKDERFEKLSFRPIVQTFKITNGELIIPRTEIQSSALQLFAEGSLKFNEYMNIWLSLPWKNLKNNDGLTLPEKTTFANAGSKFYIQLLQDKTAEKEKNKKLKVKFRLSNRKLRKLKSKRN